MRTEEKNHSDNNTEITAENNLISNWLKDNGDPAITKLVDKNLAIANKIADLLKQKDMRPADLAKAMGKRRSEISKWLSGTHTFTTKTITKIECTLSEEIIYVEPIIKNVYWTTYINANSIDIDTDSYEESSIDDSELALAQ